ncbi:MAG: bifunctional 5,10-methylenetetrahydrofolate dehydrogenase/5,10-methenyltetrahydrofolate cyclohydrolase [Chloroflexi bacterium]|nr:bifunctional 5,10-methylenetetrahydrofolate dehydrogenase/5,10-methenyltetrahydrofolate cyclohydrolase [Chloroflexota bacterium]
MVAAILDGVEASAALRADVSERVHAFTAEHGYAPGLVTVMAGGDRSAAAYVRALARVAGRVGIQCRHVALPADGDDLVLRNTLHELNEDRSVHGVIVQMPIPRPYSSSVVAETLSPFKDVDGITPHNAGMLSLGHPLLVPSTPLGGMELLRHHEIPLLGAHVTIVGRSVVIGRPLAMMMVSAGATVTICHTATRGLAEECRKAEILCVAAGRPGLIDRSMVGAGAVVVDFGTTYDADGTVHGDVCFHDVREIAGWISPVPGGTLPMTTAVLMRNTLDAAIWQVAARQG